MCSALCAPANAAWGWRCCPPIWWRKMADWCSFSAKPTRSRSMPTSSIRRRFELLRIDEVGIERERVGFAEKLHQSAIFLHQIVGQHRHPQAALAGAHNAEHIVDGQTRHPVSYTHLRAHETDSYLVCRLLLEKKKN